MSRTKLSYLSIAVEEASASDMNFALGACIVSGGKILSRGHNVCRTYSGQSVGGKMYDGEYKILAPSLHAEIAALRMLFERPWCEKQRQQEINKEARFVCGSA